MRAGRGVPAGWPRLIFALDADKSANSSVRTQSQRPVSLMLNVLPVLVLGSFAAMPALPYAPPRSGIAGRTAAPWSPRHTCMIGYPGPASDDSAGAPASTGRGRRSVLSGGAAERYRISGSGSDEAATKDGAPNMTLRDLHRVMVFSAFAAVGGAVLVNNLKKRSEAERQQLQVGLLEIFPPCVPCLWRCKFTHGLTVIRLLGLRLLRPKR